MGRWCLAVTIAAMFHAVMGLVVFDVSASARAARRSGPVALRLRAEGPAPFQNAAPPALSSKRRPANAGSRAPEARVSRRLRRPFTPSRPKRIRADSRRSRPTPADGVPPRPRPTPAHVPGLNPSQRARAEPPHRLQPSGIASSGSGPGHEALGKREPASKPSFETSPQPSAAPKLSTSKTDLEAYWRRYRRVVEDQKRYPRMARRLRLEGWVRVRVAVDRAGRLVGAPTVAKSSGHPVLDEEALRMIQSVDEEGSMGPLPSGWSGPAAETVLAFEFELTN